MTHFSPRAKIYFEIFSIQKPNHRATKILVCKIRACAIIFSDDNSIGMHQIYTFVPKQNNMILSKFRIKMSCDRNMISNNHF